MIVADAIEPDAIEAVEAAVDRVSGIEAPVDVARVEALISALDPAELEQAFEAEVGLGSSAAASEPVEAVPAPAASPDEAVAAERVAEAPTPGGDAAPSWPASAPATPAAPAPGAGLSVVPDLTEEPYEGTGTEE